MRGQWLVGMAGVLVGLVACEGKHREFVSGPLPGDGIEGAASTAGGGDAGEQLERGGDSGATLPPGALGAGCVSEADGEVRPCILPPACDPAAPDCVAPCPGCLIDGECVGLGASNPANLCQICDPERASAGWSSNDGVQCDDGLFCTVEDVCGEGACTGAARMCDDGVACNGVSECDEGAKSCSAFANQCSDNAICDTASGECVTTCDGCTIAGSCVQDGVELAGNSCMVCNVAQSRNEFTPAVGKSCGSAAGVCSLQDTCDAAGGCQPNHSPPGTTCGSSAASQCDQSDACDGSGACLQRRASNATPCDDGQFCTTGDECQGGICVPAGGRNCGAGSTCDESRGQCVAQAPAALVTDAAPLAFGRTLVGDVANVQRTWIVRNTGALATALLQPSTSAEFPMSGTCLGQTLPGGASCALSISFAPQSAGTRSTTLSLRANGAALVSVAISGEARLANGEPCPGNVSLCDSNTCTEWFVDVDGDGFGSRSTDFPSATVCGDDSVSNRPDPFVMPGACRGNDLEFPYVLRSVDPQGRLDCCDFNLACNGMVGFSPISDFSVNFFPGQTVGTAGLGVGCTPERDRNCDGDETPVATSTGGSVVGLFNVGPCSGATTEAACTARHAKVPGAAVCGNVSVQLCAFRANACVQSGGAQISVLCL